MIAAAAVAIFAVIALVGLCACRAAGLADRAAEERRP